jgi:periodic tryptophan protein 1
MGFIRFLCLLGERTDTKFRRADIPSGPNNPSTSRFTLSAHDNAAFVLDINPHVRGVLVTGGTDKIVNVTEGGDGKRGVTLPVTSRDLGLVRIPLQPHRLFAADAWQGKVFSTTWSPDDTLVLAAGGSAGKLQVWDVGANQNARKMLCANQTEVGKTRKEKAGRGIIGVADDGDGNSDDGE